MYEAFYGLTEKPFNLTPDPRFLYLSEKHKEAFAHLLFGIKNRSGFIMVSGEIGTGKTTICRSLLNQLDPDTELAFIFNPCLSPEELLRAINQDFGIESHGQTLKELIDELNVYLLDRNAKGKNCVLVIDEAQNLSPNVLEQIRLLSNLETETQKLLQIVLIGQPELAQHLLLPELRQLNQRITARYHLKPLSQEETLQYIAYRIRMAGGRKKVHFAPGAIKTVYKQSRGTPRVINALCDRALLIGYTKEARLITTGIIRQAAKEIRGEILRSKKSTARSVLWRFLPNPTLVATALVILLLIKYLGPNTISYVVPPTQHTTSSGPQNDPLPNAPEQDPHGSPSETLPAIVDDPPPTIAVAATALAATKPGSDPISEIAKTVANAPTSPQTPRIEPAFKKRLANADPTATRQAALAALLRAWNMAAISEYPGDDDIKSLTRFASTSGLTCEAPIASLDSVTAIGLPALVWLRIEGKNLWAALVGIEGDAFRLTAEGNETLLAPGDEFRECFAGQALVMWRDPEPTGKTLRPGVKGPEVLELQRNLRSLGRYSAEPTGIYDDVTSQAVARIQVETGIRIDAMAGRQVRMVLCSWLPNCPTPSLRGKLVGAPIVPTVARPEKPPEPPAGVDAGTPKAPPTDNTWLQDTEANEAGVPLLPIPFSAAPTDKEVMIGPIVPDATIGVETLPPLPRTDTLGPPKTSPPKEVTPPLDGNLTLLPHEPRKNEDQPR